MDYQRHYDNLIIRARSRVLDGYVERHHVRPLCLGGTDEIGNLVALTPEEHYTAHLLLAKIHRNDARLLYAANMMMVNNPAQHRTQNKMYGWLRKAIDEAQRLRKPSEETRGKLRQSRKGRTPALGMKHTEETKQRQGERSRAYFDNKSIQERKNTSAKAWATKKANGYFVKPETGRKIREALQGSTMLADKVSAMSPEQRSEKSYKSWVTRRANGKDHPTDLTRQRQSAAQLARYQTIQ
jgi:hypothetical protein